jgi:excisionase family DNA binding protein
MPGPRPKIDPLLTPRETAALFHVDPRTVTRWAREGKMPSTRTLGGHRRYREADVMALLHPETAAANPLTGKAPGKPRRSGRGGMALPGIFLV